MRTLNLLLLITITVLLQACKKENTGGQQLTGTWSKAGPTGTGFNYVIVIDDNTKTAKIGYQLSTGGTFTQTESGTYTRTESEIVITDGSCPGVYGTYNFTVSNTTLNMYSATDSCNDGITLRRSVINGDWARQ